MTFLFSVAVLSGLWSLYAFFVPQWADSLLISVPCFVASLFLLIGQLGRHSRPMVRGRKAIKTPRRVSVDPSKRSNWAIVDGSNVMHWHLNEPNFAPLSELNILLKKKGYQSHYFFDANAGYLLEGRYLHDQDFEQRLNLRRGSVTVVPKGQPADPLILQDARRKRAVVITNDQYRDWAGDFPDLCRNGKLVRGEYRSGKLWVDLARKNAPGDTRLAPAG